MNTIMNRLSILVFGLLVSLSSIASPSKTTDTLGTVQINQILPSFGGYDLNDNYISSKHLLGKHDVLVVSYFATWCMPCKKGLPIIEKNVQANDRINAVYIALGESDTEKVREFASSLGVESTIVLDKFQTIGTRHGVVTQGDNDGLPRTFIMDGNGKIHTIFIEEGDDFAQLLKQSFTELGVQ
jgi:peroxiredoxin